MLGLTELSPQVHVFLQDLRLFSIPVVDLAYVKRCLFGRKRKVRVCGSRSVSATREDSVGVCANFSK